MFGRLFLSTGSDTFAGAKAKSFAPSAPPYSIYDRLVLTITCTLTSSKNNEFFLRRRVASPKIMDFFCAAGLQVKKQWISSAPQGCMSKNNGFFLRRRVASPKIMDFFCAAGLHVKKRWPVFCAAGLHVKKRWPFSAPQGCKSKNSDFFLRRRLVRQKTTSFFCARGSGVKK